MVINLPGAPGSLIHTGWNDEECPGVAMTNGIAVPLLNMDNHENSGQPFIMVDS